jgi:hypothetical protein
MSHVQTSPPSYIGPEAPADALTEPEALVVLPWAVPTAAKVSAPRQVVSVATIIMRPASVTSTVPAKVITELRANNTVLPTRWCTTATLTAGPAASITR